MPSEEPRAIRLDVTESQYHADPCETPSINVSVAKVIVDHASPLHGRWAHPRLGFPVERNSDSLDRGSILHRMLLDKNEDGIVEIHADDYRKKDAREARDAARAAGMIPVKSKDLESLRESARRMKNAILEAGVNVHQGEHEVAVQWTETTLFGDVLARARFDMLDETNRVIRDLKTTGSANPDDVIRGVIKNGYDIQGAAYRRAGAALLDLPLHEVEFEFVFAEVSAPYGVHVATLSPTFEQIGISKWERACDGWARGLAGTWDSYPKRGILEPPPWLLKQEIEAAEL